MYRRAKAEAKEKFDVVCLRQGTDEYSIDMLKIYLDTCCYNRPYDDQNIVNIYLETQAILYIKYLIQKRKICLVTSFILLFENSNNPDLIRKNIINDFMNKYSSQYIGIDFTSAIAKNVQHIMAAGIKDMDARHISCAMIAHCDYFISTDRKLLKYKSDDIKLYNPIDFLQMEDDIK